MTDRADDDNHAAERDEPAGGDFEYDEAHGGGDTGPDVPAGLQDEARRVMDLHPHP